MVKKNMESMETAPEKEDLTATHEEVSTKMRKQPIWRKYCPSWCDLAQAICIALIMLLIWCVLYATLGSTAAPGGQLFNMCILVLSSYIGGIILLKLTTLPALIGMLLVGILFKNVGLIDIQGYYIQLNMDLRKVALVIILSRAGLGLDLDIMKKHYATVLKLGLIPWVVECVAIAVMTRYVLGLPFLWGFLLGSMIASVSPAVVVPCLFRLREQGYGVAKGIPTLVLAAAGIDDSISVASFGIIHSAVFSQSSLTYTIIKGPLSIIVGIGFGVVWGIIAKLIPDKGDTYVSPLRFLFVFCGGLFAVFGSNLIGWGGAGPLAVVACGFTAAIFWSKQGWAVNNNPVCTIFRVFWIIFEPILFAFTGAQIEISQLDPFVVKWAVLCLFVCLLLRLISTYFVGFGCGLNAKEKIFIGITWMAKATVQAALGAVALDTVRLNPNSAPEEHRYGEILLTTSVLSIILTAPLGALLITILGPKLLSREDAPLTADIAEERTEV